MGLERQRETIPGAAGTRRRFPPLFSAASLQNACFSRFAEMFTGSRGCPHQSIPHRKREGGLGTLEVFLMHQLSCIKKRFFIRIFGFL
jgi:hypothetical protein